MQPYPPIHGLNARLFDLPADGLSPEAAQQAIDHLRDFLTRQSNHFLGYQGNQDVSHAQALAFLLSLNTNNVGDPFANSNCTVNTKAMERAVLDYIARLWHAGTPSDADDPESYWGYIVSMGSTEGNLYGLYNARDYLAGRRLWREPTGTLAYIKPLPQQANANAYRPIAFFGEDTHYSVVKIVRSLAIRTFYEIGEQLYPGQCPINGGEWPTEVPSIGGNAGPGSVDIDALVALVEFFANRGYPPLIVLNLGTTFKGAYDDVARAGERLLPILRRAGLEHRVVNYDPDDPTKLDTRDGYWIHVDAALGGSYMPFLEMAYTRGLVPACGPRFDFRLPFVHSIVTSTHKWPGSPLPGGVYMTKRKFTIAPPDSPEYISAPDSTFAGSRNALSPAILWSYYAHSSYDQEIERIVSAQERTTYFEERLREIEAVLGAPLWIARSPLALTVRFRRPNDALVFKYSLSAETQCIDGEARAYVHIYVMQSATKEKLDQLLADLAAPGAFDLSPAPACEEVSGGRRAVSRLVHVPHEGRGFR